MEAEWIRYVIGPVGVAVIGLIPVWLSNRKNKAQIKQENTELLIKQDHELREEIKLLWEENRRLRAELDELRSRLK